MTKLNKSGTDRNESDNISKISSPRPFYTNASKRAAVVELLRDRSILQKYSNRKIGRLAGVSEGLVRKLLEEIQRAHLSKSRQRLLALSQKCDISLEVLEEVIKNLVEIRWTDTAELQEPLRGEKPQSLHQKERKTASASSLSEARSSILKNPPRKADWQNSVKLTPESEHKIYFSGGSSQHSTRLLAELAPMVHPVSNENKRHTPVRDLSLTIRRFLGEHSQPEDISQPMRGKIYLTLDTDLEEWSQKLVSAYNSAEVSEAIVLLSESQVPDRAVKKLITLATGLCVIFAQPNLVALYFGSQQARFVNFFENWGLVTSLKISSQFPNIVAKPQNITTSSEIKAAINHLPNYEVQKLFFLLEVTSSYTQNASSLTNEQVLSRLESALTMADINAIIDAVGLSKLLAAYRLVHPIYKKQLDSLCPSLESLSRIY